MPEAALVLSGGGAKGAFEVMAEKYAREQKGYKWNIIAGVSVGALNGVMIASEQYQRLEQIWKTISNDQVYTGGLKFWSIVKIIFGAKSFYGNDPLHKINEKEIDPSKIKTQLRIGYVSLLSGEYIMADPSKPPYIDNSSLFKQVVLASTVMPIIWTRENKPPFLSAAIDGGLRNTSPLGDVLEFNPEVIVVINCNPRKPQAEPKSNNNIIEITKRSIDIALNEILAEDVEEFDRINKLVRQAHEKGFTLTKDDGSAYREYTLKIIEPDELLDDTLDFSQPSIRR